MCLDVPYGGTYNGNQLQLWECQVNNFNQMFGAPSLGTPWSPGGRLIKSRLNGLCIDASNYASGGPALMQPCSTLGKQSWNTDAAGALRSQGIANICLFASTALTDTRVRVGTCTGGTNERWFMDPLGRLRPHSIPDRCLDITGGSTAALTPLQHSNCLDVNWQKWFVW